MTITLNFILKAVCIYRGKNLNSQNYTIFENTLTVESSATNQSSVLLICKLYTFSHCEHGFFVCLFLATSNPTRFDNSSPTWFLTVPPTSGTPCEQKQHFMQSSQPAQESVMRSRKGNRHQGRKGQSVVEMASCLHSHCPLILMTRTEGDGVLSYRTTHFPDTLEVVNEM